MALNYTPTTLGDLSNEVTFLSELNLNFSELATLLQDALSRSGDLPNSWEADQDADSFNLNNLGSLTVGVARAETLYLDGSEVPSLQDVADLYELIKGELTSNLLVVDNVTELRALSGHPQGSIIALGGDGSGSGFGFIEYTVDTASTAVDDGKSVIEMADGSRAIAVSTHTRSKDDGGVLGGWNAKPVSPYATIADDVRVSYIAWGGRDGFPNRIGTFTGSLAYYGTIGGGYDNTIDSIAGTIAGGAHHYLYGDEPNTSHNTIGGGSFNSAERGEYTTISGGTQNTMAKLKRDGVTETIPTQSTIGGGNGNTCRGGNSVIGGGLSNDCDGGSATIGGGQLNIAEGNFVTVSGGGNNEARSGTLGGGSINTIGGGRYNIIDSTTNCLGNTVSGGQNCEAYGNFNSIGGGNTNTIGTSGTVATLSTIAGGSLNTIAASANGATVSGGRENTASAEYSYIPGGRENEVDAAAKYAGSYGYQANAKQLAGRTIADGAFSAPGDAQSTVVTMKVETTDATVTAMTKSNTAASLVMGDDTTWMFTAEIVARRTDADGESAAYKIEGCIDRNTGAASTAIVGAATKTVIAEDTAAWDVSVSANTVTGGLVINVTGEAAKTIRWFSRVTLVEVSG